MNNLNSVTEKYVNCHKISKSVNILEIAKLAAPDQTIKPLKCVCNFLMPVDGWDSNIYATSSDEEKCYYCSQQLANLFSDYKAKISNIQPPSVDNIQCQYCYWFCCHKYVTTGQMHLIKKFIKGSKIR